MKTPRPPITPAIRVLRAARVTWQDCPYDWVEGGGTAEFARQHSVEEHRVIKTLIMEDDSAVPMIVLMHGDLEVSTRSLARELGVKHVTPCEPAIAERHSGYRVGGTSPFGTRRTMPIVCHITIAELPFLYINGGKRGYILRLDTSDLLAVLEPRLVHIAQ
ncbi:MAG: Cys-tRNA(Pro) deacylase [Gemmatimonadetes bacterium]|jgi:Cys-tRNA(Pro) deacylase|nr:Cys-tRNA(Pro) deacylase [Gemmatimonadota bacterium]MBT6145316.1 Cys-tRNA(Pro) deacylase [Gemmatimonadota bacterium]MBT7860970.1 Cys-tRNA(Pro) deacylase [Gemmatimonadota bacterium]